MTLTIVLRPEHSLPLAAGIASCFLLTWLGIRVGGARRKAKVDYPHMYASIEDCEKDSAKKVYNCVQRAHQK